MKTKIIQDTKDIDYLKKEVESKDSEIDKMKTKIIQDTKDIDYLKKEVESKDSEIDKMKTKIIQDTKDIDYLKKEVESKDSEIDKMKTKIIQDTKDIEYLRKAIFVRDQKVKKLEKKGISDTLDLEHLKKRLSVKHIENKEINSKFTGLRLKFNSKRQSVLNNFKKIKWMYTLYKSNEFSYHWYINEYPDVREWMEKERGVISRLRDSKLNIVSFIPKVIFHPIYHYVSFGAYEGRNPSYKFSTIEYLKDNDDVLAKGVNPFYHYIKIWEG